MAHQHHQRLVFMTPIRREILSFAFPASIESLFFMWLGIIDQIFISYLGSNVLGAVGIINILFLYAELTLSSLGLGMSTLISRNYGENNHESFSETAGQFTSLTVGIAIIFSIFTVLFRSQLLTLIGATGTILDNGMLYLSFVAWAFPLTICKEMFTKIIRATGDSRTPMMISIVVIILNTGLNYIAVFGLFGFPPTGIAGVAAATILSTLLGFLLAFYYVKRNHFYIFRLSHFKHINKKVIVTILGISVPIFSSEIFRNLSIVALFVFYTRLGGDQLVAGQIVFNIETFYITFAYGLCPSGLVMIGHRIGAKDYKYAMYISRQHVILTIIVGFITGICTVITSKFVYFIYNDLGPVVEYFVIYGLVMFGVFQPIKSLSMVFRNGVLRTLGFNSFLWKAEMTTAFIIISLCYILGFILNFGIIGVFAANIIGETLKVGAYTNKYLSIDWLKISPS